MKTYKCPFCDYRGEKNDLASHIDEKHHDMIPENFTGSRMVFNLVNKKTHGVCVVCKKPTDWNENTRKYSRLCNNPKCRVELRKTYETNMIRVHNTTTLLDDPEHQQKMLANRSISGKYRFKNGQEHTYTGSYEKKALEFFDNVLNADPKDIIAPGPTIEYEFQGKKLKWITDILYIPYNLIIEVKDGGSNPNNRNMDTYRSKQIAKEKMITSLGTYNYLRLTDNNFSQLLEVMAELKAQMMDDSEDNKKVIIKINESTIEEACDPGGMPVGMNNGPNSRPFIVQYNYRNTFTDDVEGFALTKDLIDSKLLRVDENGNFVVEDQSFLEGRKFNIYKYIGDMTRYKALLNEAVGKKPIAKTGKDLYDYIYKNLSPYQVLSNDQIEYDDNFEKVNLEDYINKTTTEVSTMIENFHILNGGVSTVLPLIDNDDIVKAEQLKMTYPNLTVLEDENGYFAYDIEKGLRTISYKDINDIKG